MVEVLLITHGELGTALVAAAGMISGSTDGAHAISFLPGQGVEDLEAAIATRIAAAAPDTGTLCLVDLPGGSPARAAAMVASQFPTVEVVAGVNIPMLVEVLLLREAMSVRDLAVHAAQTGCEGIVDIGALLRSQIEQGG